MRITEMEPYINGRKFTRPTKAPYRGNAELFEDIYKLVQQSSTATNNANLYEIPAQFYQAEPDIKHFVPLQAREEMFYAIKNTFISESVPAKCIYYVRKAYNTYKIPNLIFKLIPDKELEIMFQQNYMADGYTLRDVICTFCNDQYTPLSDTKYSVPLGEYSEIYIESKDMVAIIPQKIAQSLSYSDIQKLEVDEYGIKLGTVYLKFTNGYHGAANSIYDLRVLI